MPQGYRQAPTEATAGSESWGQLACDRLSPVLSIGLVGGMGWESSLQYYLLLNQRVEERLGGRPCARLVLSSGEFAELTELQEAERWDEVAALLAQAARGVEAAGADLLPMCNPALHTVA